MAGERLTPRFYGSEVEYTYTLPQDMAVDPDPRFRFPENMPASVPRVGQFLANGSRFYVDVSTMLEYATPECPTLNDVVKHELAGERLIWDAYGNNSSPAVTIHKRSLSPVYRRRGFEIKSFGAHENYSTTVHFSRTTQDKREILASHFATRTIFIGAGQPTEKDYILGQKMQQIVEDRGANSTSNKALVNTKDEPHGGGDSRLSRLHVVCGDANISPWAIRMKFGTTSLVLRLLERHTQNIGNVLLESPLNAAHRVASGVDGIDMLLRLRSGKTATAINIQEGFFEHAHKLSSEVQLPEEELEVLAHWRGILDSLRHYRATGEPQSEMNQIDWYVKKRIIDAQDKKNGGLNNAQKAACDLLYDKVPDGGGIKLRKTVFAAHTPQDADIEKAKTTPPEGRAKLRGALIERLVAKRKSIQHERFIEWGRSVHQQNPKEFGPVDVFYNDEELEKKINELSRRII